MARYLQLTQRGRRSTRLAGDYVYVKEYIVVTAPGVIDDTFNGWVVQLVQKRSEATVANGRVLRTSQDFSDFTSGKTTAMNDSYIERFPVVNGRAVDGDQFASGAVAPWDGTSHDLLMTPTSGTVNHVGTNLLFSAADADFLGGFNWLDVPNHPASGLETIDADKWPALVAHGNAAANKPIHSLIATWTPGNNTQLRVHFIDNAPGGPPGGAIGDGVATAARIAYCRALEQEALQPELTVHHVAQRADGSWNAIMCGVAACVAIGLGTIYTFMPKGGKKQTRKVRRLRK